MANHLQRLGTLVTSRRVELGYRVRVKFAKQIDLSDRLLADLEKGVRGLSVGSYAVLEQALEWQPGSIKAVLAGGDPTTVPHVRAGFSSAATLNATVVDLRSVPADTLLEEIRRRLVSVSGSTPPARGRQGIRGGESEPDDGFDFQGDAP